MYAKGMSTRDIEDHLRDIYGVDASASLISRITDKILPAAQEWQARPLESLYQSYFSMALLRCPSKARLVFHNFWLVIPFTQLMLHSHCR